MIQSWTTWGSIIWMLCTGKSVPFTKETCSPSGERCQQFNFMTELIIIISAKKIHNSLINTQNYQLSCVRYHIQNYKVLQCYIRGHLKQYVSINFWYLLCSMHHEHEELNPIWDFCRWDYAKFVQSWVKTSTHEKIMI